MISETMTSNTSTVASLYEAFVRGDITFILEHVADDCEWIGTGEGYLPSGGVYTGKDALQFFSRLKESEEFTSFTPESIHAIGNNEVVAFGTMTGNSVKTGKPLSSDWAMHWKFNGEGKVIYFHDFHDTAAAYVANQP